MNKTDQSQYGAWLRASTPKSSWKTSPQNLGKKTHFDSSSFNRQKGEEVDNQEKISDTLLSNKAINNPVHHTFGDDNTSIGESQVNKDGDSEIQGPLTNDGGN